MSLSYRKSIKIGPFRWNFSQRSVGVSTGVRGARVSTNSHGRSRATLSFHGFRYIKPLRRRR